MTGKPTNNLGLKICGMKAPQNIEAIAALKPDYMGFIFYKKSPRYVDAPIPNISPDIARVGVFVDADLSFIRQKIKDYNLQAVQLHGQESASFCQDLKTQESVNIIKAFSVRDDFNFNRLTSYLKAVDYFLFDTKGKNPGGNGRTFNWEILKDYPFHKPFFLSGGIGLTEISSIQQLRQKNLPLHAVDVNSKFETQPGEKDIETVKEFKNQLAL